MFVEGAQVEPFSFVPAAGRGSQKDFKIPAKKTKQLQPAAKVSDPLPRKAGPLLTLREKITELSLHLGNRVWLNIYDYARLLQHFNSNVDAVNSSATIGGVYAKLHNDKIQIYVSSLIPEGKIFCNDQALSEIQLKEELEIKPHRLIDHAVIRSKSDLIEAVDRHDLAAEQLSIKNAEIVKRMESEKAEKLAKENEAAAKSETFIISGDNPTLLTSTIATSGDITLNPFTFTAATSDNIQYYVPSFSTIVTDIFKPVIDGIFNTTNMENKFITELKRFARSASFANQNHIWINAEEFKEHIPGRQHYETFSDGCVYKTFYAHPDIPRGFMFANNSVIRPVIDDTFIRKRAASILNLEEGFSLSVQSTAEKFAKARQEMIAKKFPSIAQIQEEEDKRVLAELDKAVKEKENRKKLALAARSAQITPLEDFLKAGDVISQNERINYEYEFMAKKFDTLLREAYSAAKKLSGVSDADAKLTFTQGKNSNELHDAYEASHNGVMALGSVLNSFGLSTLNSDEIGRGILAEWQDFLVKCYEHLASASLKKSRSSVEEFGRQWRNKIRAEFGLPAITTIHLEEEVDSLPSSAKNYAKQYDIVSKLSETGTLNMEMKMSETFEAAKPAVKSAAKQAYFQGEGLKEDKYMTQKAVVKKSFTEDVVDAFDEAKWRVAQKQVVRRLRDAVVIAIKNIGHDRAEVKLFEKALKTQLGEGMIALFLGLVASRIPFLADNPQAIKLFQECKIAGMADVGDDIIERVAGEIVPMVMGALQSSLADLPEVRIEVKEKPKKVRIKAPPKKTPVEDEDEEEAESEATAAAAEAKSAKRATAETR